ncbi:low temperature requirement protein LtrA [Microbacteriaceae bacterium SG_E_30_P1]|uniref:Low temperature requirement protein LtrA n=1 Tax=Antiquaquibacter oligotrophicus TaxID=2880260 RepID=A0ABT6KJV8_9MICO|nr:low temperature requirement protein A [Antiquaquibacter oligotrophicus]MDH6180285.1 low temperature requirement protein LtrA [Antiquaquibacter oligotrophicus]UDF13968.1 low temperature requirement protein A [Antiquaquibacter oligotrophicus]
MSVSEPKPTRHRLARMAGRDPGERHRAATPLELLFDLAFVVAFGQAGDQLAHAIAADHVGTGIAGFAFALGATCWAWINFSWFSSAYDTDDWLYRVLTMVQMIGVVVFALGLPEMFHSLEEGHTIDNGVMVAGYVVMRVALIAQWLRAARQDPARRRTALTYAVWVGVAQVGWIVLLVLHTSPALFFVAAIALFVVEATGPIVSEGRTSGTPWHPHHIAERYGLLAIIALGEGVIGTVAAVSGFVQEDGWSADAVIIVTAGIGLTFGLWWIYFIAPAGEVLSRHRERSWVWGYGHVLVFASIAATGAGLHVAAYVAKGETDAGSLGATAAVAIPVAVYLLAIVGLDLWLVRTIPRFKVVLLAVALIVLAGAVVLAALGDPLSVSLLIVMLAPAIMVVGFEIRGHRRNADALEVE